MWTEGKFKAVTVLEVDKCVVAQHKSTETDGVRAVQLACTDKHPKHFNSAAMGHFSRWGVASPKRTLRQVRVLACEGSIQYRLASDSRTSFA